MVRKELRCPLCNSPDVLVKRKNKMADTGKIMIIARCQVCYSTFLHEQSLQESDNVCC